MNKSGFTANFFYASQGFLGVLLIIVALTRFDLIFANLCLFFAIAAGLATMMCENTRKGRYREALEIMFYVLAFGYAMRGVIEVEHFFNPTPIHLWIVGVVAIGTNFGSLIIKLISLLSGEKASPQKQQDQSQ